MPPFGSDDAATKQAQKAANDALIAARSSSNSSKAATVPSNVGRTEPAMNIFFMQGTANFVIPNHYANQRF